MKFKIDGKALRDAAALVDAAVNTKSDIPDESHVFLMASGQGTLTMVGQNDRFLVKVSNVAVTDDEEGMVLIHASYWQRLMSESNGRTVEFESDCTAQAVIRLFDGASKPVKFNFNAMAADQYVPLAIPGGAITCKVDKLHIKDGIRLVRPTADSGNSLDIANGVCFEFDTKDLRLVATDMSALGYAEVTVGWNGQGSPTSKQIRVLSREALDMVDRMIATLGESDIEIRVGDGLVGFTGSNLEIISKTMPSGTQYIDWQRIVPSDIDGSNFTTTVGAITSAMSLAEVVNGGDPVSVDFEITGDKISVFSIGLGGTQTGEVTASSTFGEGEFRLDSRLVRSALRGLDSNTVLQIAPVNSGKQVQVNPTLPNLGENAFQIWAGKTRKAKEEAA